MNVPGKVRGSPPFGSAQGKLRENATGGASRVVMEYGWASPHQRSQTKVRGFEIQPTHQGPTLPGSGSGWSLGGI